MQCNASITLLLSKINFGEEKGREKKLSCTFYQASPSVICCIVFIALKFIYFLSEFTEEREINVTEIKMVFFMKY